MAAKTRIYCSGPLFCPEEQAGMAALAHTLQDHGFDTFLPQRDGLEPLALPLLGSRLAAHWPGGRAAVDRAIFALDVFQIARECAAVVVNLNGRVPDEGAVVEAALAFSLGKPVVFYKEDHRAPFAGVDNAMILGLSAHPPVTRLKQVPAAVKKALATATGDSPALSAQMKKTVALGKQIWQVLAPLNLPEQPGPQAAALLKEILSLAERE